MSVSFLNVSPSKTVSADGTGEAGWRNIWTVQVRGENSFLIFDTESTVICGEGLACKVADLYAFYLILVGNTRLFRNSSLTYITLDANKIN